MQPQEEGVTERGVPGARGARHGQVGLCCVPATLPGVRGLLQSIRSRAEGTVTPSGALGPGSRHPRWVPGIPPLHVVLSGGTTLSSRGEGPSPSSPPSRPRARATTQLWTSAFISGLRVPTSRTGPLAPGEGDGQAGTLEGIF